MPWRRKRSIVASGRIAAELARDRVRGQVLGVGHRDRRAEARREPRRVADVVGMVVRRDDAPDRHRGERRRDVALPERAGREIAVAAVDERGAAVGFGEQPEIDVIERERQRHPQPEHARRDLDRRRRGARRGIDGIGQGLREVPSIGEAGFLCAAASSGKSPRLSSRYAIVTDLARCAFRAPPRSDVRRQCPRGPRQADRCRADGAHVLDFRPRAGIRADDARDPLLRGRGPARAAPPRARRGSTASASARGSS